MKNSISKSGKIVFRKMAIDDYDAVIRLWKKSGLPYKSAGRDRKDKIAVELEQPTSYFLVAELNSGIIAVVFGTHDGRKGWINRLAVLPEFRGKGIARKLVSKVENYFAQIGIEITACLIEDWNKASLETFEKLGYTRHNDIFYLSKRKTPEV